MSGRRGSGGRGGPGARGGPGGRGGGAGGRGGRPGGGDGAGRPRHRDDDRPFDVPAVVLLEGRARFMVGERFFERGRRVTIGRSPRDARPGLLALVKPEPGGARASVVRMLGSPDVARDVLEALMLDRGLRRRFPPGVERAATDARERPHDPPERRDLRELPTFTIDPATAKDFDDAISAQALTGGRTRVWVHIADVSAYVRPGGPVDREAYRRGTSVYVPGAVEPMLPEALSNDACSLVPGKDRLAVTAELELDGAQTVKATFYRSLICSDARLDYEQVDRIFAGSEPAREPWAAPLAAARAASAALEEARRAGGGALAIESVEPEFAFDDRGAVTGAVGSVQTESHRLIEHLMIAANEAVARLLSERGAPALHRVHERPEPEKVLRLLDQLASLGVATPPAPPSPSPSQAAEIVAQASLLVDAHVRRTGHGRTGLTFLVLRALQQARYDPRSLGHAGLGLTHYCHFTSPIRRYPDLVCHRALLAVVGGGEDPPRAHGLQEAGEWCSAREREAMAIERAADDVARCFLLERELRERGWDEPFGGEVTGLINAGAFVMFGGAGAGAEDARGAGAEAADGGAVVRGDDDGAASRGAGPYEGMLPVRRIPGGWWELNEEGTILRSDGGGTLRLGDPVRVGVERIEAPRGRVDLRVEAGSELG